MRDRSGAQSIIDCLVTQHSRDALIRETRLLAASTQARVFFVDLEGRPGPVVVKLFSEKRPNVAAALDDEFESLTVMSAAFRGGDVDGWHVTAPEPLLRSASPPALLMTAVPGVPLERLLPTLARIERQQLARSVCAALVVYWSSTGRIFADVTLSNILADVGTRQLAFVDPGLPEPWFSCPGISTDFAPGSRDLACLLFSVLATNVRIGLVARRRARVRAAFATDVVRHYAVEHVATEQLSAFLAEVGGCAEKHMERIPVGGPRELWRRFIRKQVNRRLKATLDELASR